MSYVEDPNALVVPSGQGEVRWHLDTLWTFKLPAAPTGGAFSLVEQLIPKGSAPPVHRHTREDEASIVLDGAVTFFIDDEQHHAGPGTYVFGPRGRAHTIASSRIPPESHPAHPGTCEAFFRTTGRPADSRALPPPQEPDLDQLLAAMREHGIEFLGPPPTN